MVESQEMGFCKSGETIPSVRTCLLYSTSLFTHLFYLKVRQCFAASKYFEIDI